MLQRAAAAVAEMAAFGIDTPWCRLEGLLDGGGPPVAPLRTDQSAHSIPRRRIGHIDGRSGWKAANSIALSAQSFDRDLFDNGWWSFAVFIFILGQVNNCSD